MRKRHYLSLSVSIWVIFSLVFKGKYFTGFHIRNLEPTNKTMLFYCVIWVGCLMISANCFAQITPKKDSIRSTLPIPVKTWKDSAQHIKDSLFKAIKIVSQIKTPKFKADSLSLRNLLSGFEMSDSVPRLKDSVSGILNSFAQQEKQRLLSGLPTLKIDSTWKYKLGKLNPIDSTFKSVLLDPFRKLSTKQPFIQFGSGFVTYNFSYRSNIDTPYIEKDINQHQLMAGLNLTVARFIPLRVNAFIRRSNSSLFQSINDVQVLFDGNAYRNQVSAMMKQKTISQVQKVKDSLLRELADLEKYPDRLLDGYRDKFTLQKLAQAKELVKVPELSYDISLPDSVNRQRADSLQRAAKLFIETYEKIMHAYNSLAQKADSLKQLYEGKLKRIREYESMIKSKSNGSAYDDLAEQKVRDMISSDSLRIPDKYRWIMNVRNFALGRNTVNSSDLTTRNVSVTGLNFEYNSWYYLAVTAGLVDYRFRDFVIGTQKKTPQYLYQLRLGVGRLEKNYFILTAFHGKKQLFASTGTASVITSIKVSGISAESKWQINRNSYIIGEIAQSMAPDFRTNPPKKQVAWNWSDKTNKAYSIRFSSIFPKTASRLEGQYKFTGANYQSFNSFQTNAATTSWWVRGEQSFFRRQLKLTGALRSNDFYNPYILQNYKSNTIFKSINASFRAKGWPVISVGYMPMSQLTVLDSLVVENRFQTLNASLTHFYKIGTRSAASNVVYTKFYNNSSDSNFIYYNAANLFVGQTIFFKGFNGSVNISQSKSTDYEYIVMEENFNLTLFNRGSIGFGVKINNLNRLVTKVGGFLNASLMVTKTDVLYLYFENGYLPGSGNQLRKNLIGNVSFTKTFR